MFFLVLLWAMIPGELVMKNGKLLAYQGEYVVEDNLVKFTSKTGESMQLPASAVDLEKTKARDAQLAIKKAPASKLSRSEQEFQAFIEDQPSRKVALTTSVREPDPVDAVIIEDGEVLGVKVEEWPKELTLVNVYAAPPEDEREPAPSLREASNSDDAQVVARIEQRRSHYQQRLMSLQDRKNHLQVRLSNLRSEDYQPNVSDQNGASEGPQAGIKQEMIRLDEEIRLLVVEALAEGIAL